MHRLLGVSGKRKGKDMRKTKAARKIMGRIVSSVERHLYDKQGECLQAVVDAMKLVAGRKV